MEGLKWLANEVFGPLIVAGITGVCAAFYGWIKRIDGKLTRNTRDLHDRIDQVKDGYVSRESLNERMDGMDKQLDQIREDGHRRGKIVTQRLDRLFEKLHE